MLELNNIYNMDCIEGMKLIDDCSIDSIVTDPPYELGFMGKKWDNTGISYNVEVWKEALRILKPGGHLLAFGGTRTYHRMAVAIEDAGFDIRDQIMWIYGSGFPKSLNIGKAVDKSQGNERDVMPNPKAKQQTAAKGGVYGDYEAVTHISKGTSEYEGWGTALKPASEPIVVARKPLSEKTVVENVLKWGTGGINIDGCRIELINPEIHKTAGKSGLGNSIYGEFANDKDYTTKGELLRYNEQGRFPANIIFDEESAVLLDEQTGILKSGDNCTRTKVGSFLEHGGLGKAGDVQTTYGDKGGASRFFYCAKSSKSERGEGNTHPTVKPIKLIEYLIKLVTPPSGICVDPFMGSGTTAVSATNNNINYIGFELDESYCEIAKKRLRI